MAPVVIIDYGMGNIGSVANMVKRIGHPVLVTSDEKHINDADKIILPGVGHFDHAMKNLEKRGLSQIIRDKSNAQDSILLGICLGMHLFCATSEEGDKLGLGIFDIGVRKFKFGDKSTEKIPHMDWNTLEVLRGQDWSEPLDQYERYYFAHSYHVEYSNEFTVCTTKHGYSFPSVIKKGKTIGLQFHPEKSHNYGMNLLKNILGRPR